MTLAEQIKAAQDKLLASKDALVAVTKSMEENPEDESLVTQLEELSGRVEAETKSVDSLLRAEAALAAKAVQASPAVVQAKHMGQKGSADLFFKAAAAVAEAHVKRVPVAQILADRYKSDESTDMIVKAATGAAMTNVDGWAAELTRVTSVSYTHLTLPTIYSV